jgi:hypothetical protein
MLVSDKYGFVIAMPTKTGTNSVRAIVEKWKRAGGSPRVLDLLTGEKATRHRIAPPPGKEDYTRYMLVRNPQARLVSMYEYLRRKEWEWSAKDLLHREAHYGREDAWLQLLRIINAVRAADGYEDPGRRAAHGKRPYMWTDTLSEMLDYMGGVDIDGSKLPWHTWDDAKPLMLEDLESEWGDLLVREGVDEDGLYDLAVSHRNATPGEDKLFSGTAAYWEVDGASSLFAEYWAQEDVVLAMYEQ